MADIVVIGGGHAGCEAALAGARMGLDTLLLTLNLDGVALMACNPAIGGSAKGHLVREVDALGGEMGLAIDDTMLQSRMLNMSKGPAVHALRAQADKQEYQNRMRTALLSQDHLTVRQGEAVSIETENGHVTGVTTLTGQRIPCSAVVLCSGVYLRGRIIIGEASWDGGPQGLMNASRLSASLEELGFALRRFKTGTPARIDVRSIDFDEMTEQKGDEPVVPFSFLTDRKLENTYSCYLTWTTPETHKIILDNLHRAPLYSGKIHGIGPRYCPSIEDKVVRFADKDRHQIFLEPEGRESREWYVQGMSTSMPEDVQWEMYRTIPGLRHCDFTRLGYAIEYDCIDSLELRPTLESLRIGGLFFAGQINGTSGYEEAACQGLLAGMNAALELQGREQILLTRDMDTAKKWLHDRVRGTERTGVLVTKEAARYKPLGIHILKSGDENSVHWFLDDKSNTLSSNYLEDAATEIQVQGLELDYTCLLWDADMRCENGEWHFYRFNGSTKWNEVRGETENQRDQMKYMLNAYRVLLTRARIGMIICVPEGNSNRNASGFWEDSTRLPAYYDGTYSYLKSIGIREI